MTKFLHITISKLATIYPSYQLKQPSHIHSLATNSKQPIHSYQLTASYLLNVYKLKYQLQNQP